MVNIGPILANARRAQGKTIADAAADTKIRRDYLQALEEERFDVIGGDAWVRGFIRSYGRWLGLDTTMLIAAYEAHNHEAVSPTAIPGAHGGVVPLRFRVRAWLPFMVGFALVILVVGIYWNRGTPTPEAPKEAIAPAPVQQAQQSTVFSGQDPTLLPTPAAGEGQPEGVPMGAPSLRIQANRPVTLVVEAGKPMLNLAMQTNEIKEITDPSKVTVVLSDAGAVTVYVNGEALPPLGADKVGVELTCEQGKVACEARDR